jgi:hypothetical protein
MRPPLPSVPPRPVEALGSSMVTALSEGKVKFVPYVLVAGGGNGGALDGLAATAMRFFGNGGSAITQGSGSDHRRRHGDEDNHPGQKLGGEIVGPGGCPREGSTPGGPCVVWLETRAGPELLGPAASRIPPLTLTPAGRLNPAKDPFRDRSFEEVCHEILYGTRIGSPGGPHGQA